MLARAPRWRMQARDSQRYHWQANTMVEQQRCAREMQFHGPRPACLVELCRIRMGRIYWTLGGAVGVEQDVIAHFIYRLLETYHRLGALEISLTAQVTS